MEISEFVKAAIVGIVKGAQEADKELKELGAEVNPQGVGFVGGQGIGRLFDANRNQPVQEVDFDIALTVSESGKTEGGLGLMLASVGLGARAEHADAASQVHRLRFKVPVLLPTRGPVVVAKKGRR